MRFRITSTQSSFFGYGKSGVHTKKLAEKYPKLKNRLIIDPVEWSRNETAIDIEDLDDLLSLGCGDIIISLDYHLNENNKLVKDGEYTIEIYDGYRE